MIWPELIFIFIGDSGQGDIDTSLMMMKNNIHNMYCCFIHNIIKAKRRRKVRKHKEDDFLYDIYSNKTKQKLADLDIYFFDTYAEVFAKLFAMNIMNDSDKEKFNNHVRTQLDINNKYFKSDILYKRFINNIKLYLQNTII